MFCFCVIRRFPLLLFTGLFRQGDGTFRTGIRTRRDLFSILRFGQLKRNRSLPAVPILLEENTGWGDMDSKGKQGKMGLAIKILLPVTAVLLVASMILNCVANYFDDILDQYIGAAKVTVTRAEGTEDRLPWTGSLSENFFSLGGLVRVMSFHSYPFMTGMLKNAIPNLNGSLEKSARVSGAEPVYLFRRVTMPLLTGNDAIAMLMVFVKTLSEYGTPATLGNRISFYVFTTNIHRYASTLPIDFSKASMLSSVLVVICVLVWLLQNSVTSRHSYNRVGARGSRKQEVSRRKSVTILPTLYVAVLMLCSISVPYFSIIVTSLIKLRGYGLAKGNFTLQRTVHGKPRSGQGHTDKSYHPCSSFCNDCQRPRRHCRDENQKGREMEEADRRGGPAAADDPEHCLCNQPDDSVESPVHDRAALRHPGFHGSGVCGHVSAVFDPVHVLGHDPDLRQLPGSGSGFRRVRLLSAPEGCPASGPARCPVWLDDDLYHLLPRASRVKSDLPAECHDGIHLHRLGV